MDNKKIPFIENLFEPFKSNVKELIYDIEYLFQHVQKPEIDTENTTKLFNYKISELKKLFE